MALGMLNNKSIAGKTERKRSFGQPNDAKSVSFTKSFIISYEEYQHV